MERRRFTAEFKQEAVRQTQQPGVFRVKVDQELGLSANMLGRWVRPFSSGKWEATPGKPFKSE